MKVKNGTVFTLGNTISGDGNGLLERLASARMIARDAYNRNKSLKAIEEQFKEINKVRDDLIKKYGEEDGNGNASIKPENKDSMDKFINEFNEVLDIEEDLKISKIPLDALNNLQLNYYELEALEFMIDIPAEPEDITE